MAENATTRAKEAEKALEEERDLEEEKDGTEKAAQSKAGA